MQRGVDRNLTECGFPSSQHELVDQRSFLFALVSQQPRRFLLVLAAEVQHRVQFLDVSDSNDGERLPIHGLEAWDGFLL